ncbi:MAG TPA: alpha/beta fold hydrolase [Nocardioidaceae bacterium]|nr:alpha/beta fold hydrolase [Nocardioidaceae bacterium]
MTTMRMSDDALSITFTTAERVAGLLQDQHIPLASVRAVEVVPDGLEAARGLRAPGFALPGRRKIGTWRSRAGTSLVAVRGHRPAVRLTVHGQRYATLLITTDTPEELAASLSRHAADRSGHTSARPPAEHAVTFTSGQHTLAGSLTIPPGEGPFPAVLLLPGSGPIDRNSHHKRMPLGITGQLATALDAAGLATFRYDKRGVGASTGRWHAAGFSDNRDDAAAALQLLLTHPEVDPARVIVLGHSEGALHAAGLAADGATIAGLVLLSCSALPGEALLRWQSAQIAPTLPTPVRVLLRLLRTDLQARTAKTHDKIKATTTDEARIEGVKVNARWHREFMAHDPRTDLARIAVPVLAVTGGKDLQVPAADLAQIRELVPAPVETHEIADLSHILRAQPGPASLSGYKQEMRQPVDTGLVDLVVGWVSARVGVTR